MNMESKENWIEETIDIVDALSPVEVPEGMDAKILARFSMKRQRMIEMSAISKWSIAASILFLIGINSYSVLHYSSEKEIKIGESNLLYTEYFSYINQ